MKRIGFVGAYDKTDLILNLAKLIASLEKTVLVVDSTLTQKTRYVVPALNPSNSYITNIEGIDVSVGIYSMKDIRTYLNLAEGMPLDYDFVLFDIDNPQAINAFELLGDELYYYFVTSMDPYSYKRGFEMLQGVTTGINMTKIIFTKRYSGAEDDYLNFSTLNSNMIHWNDEVIYFPDGLGDEMTFQENHRTGRIRFRGISNQYRDSLMYLTQEIVGQDVADSTTLKKIFNYLVKGA